MKNDLFKLIKWVLLTTLLFFTVSCSDSNTEPGDEQEPMIIKMAIEDNALIISQPEIKDGVGGISDIVFTVVAGITKEGYKIAPKIEIPPLCSVKPASNQVVDFSQGEIIYTVTHEQTKKIRTYRVKCVREKYTDALITSMVIDTQEFDKLVSQPELVDGNYVFHVKPTITEEELRSSIIPTVEISAGATITPVSGEVQDFTVSGGKVVYTVMSESGNENTYELICIKDKFEGNDIVSIKISGLDKITKEPTLVEEAKYEFEVDATTTEAELKSSIIPTIDISEGATITPASGEVQDFTMNGGKVIYTVTSESGVDKIYTVTCIRKKYEGNNILSMTIDGNPLIEVQPVINEVDETIKFYLSPDATSSDVGAIKPTIEISGGAVVVPASGSVQDFTNPVSYTVTSETGISKDYIVSCHILNNEIFNFEDWAIENPTAAVDKQYFATTGWSSPNSGVVTIKGPLGTKYVGTFPLVPTDESRTGAQTAKLITINTIGKKGMGSFPAIPVVTSGSFFNGTFELDIKNALGSTKFGTPFSGVPLKVKGYYKYTPGLEYFYCPDAKVANIAAIDNSGMKDQFAVTVVLYEVSSYGDEAKGERLTGVNLYTAPSIVAKGRFESGDTKTEYTPFEVELEYIKEYDPTKLYRFAIVFSSSNKGDSYSGAPGSTLIIDDVETLYTE